MRGKARHTADFLLSGVFLIALGALLINDFIVKRFAPGVVSGKLSDVAGPIVAALILVAAAEVLAHWIWRDRWARPWWFIGFSCLVVAIFAVVKLTTLGANTYAAATTAILSVVQWGVSPFGIAISTDVPVVVRDFLDVVVALVAIPLTFWVGWRWRGPIRRPADASPTPQQRRRS